MLFKLSGHTAKLVMLIALVSTQRCQSIHMMSVDAMQILDSSYVFKIQGLFKQSRPGFREFDIVLKKFDDVRICVYTTLTEYLMRTKHLRTGPELFLSFVTPHNAVSKATLGRWIKTVMSRAGIDVSVFRPHSCRSASASRAKREGVTITEIMKKAGWADVGTFKKFYDKPLLGTVSDT